MPGPSARRPPADAATGSRQTLSGLLTEVGLTGRCWCYTDLADGAGFSVPPGEDAYVHAVLDGSVRLAGASGEMVLLGSGSAVIVLSGEAHALRTCADGNAATHPLLRANADIDVPPTLALPDGPGNTGGRIVAHILSGRLRLAWPTDIDRTALPAIVRVGQDPASDGGNAATLLLKPHALGLAGIGPGSAALLTRLAGVMLVAALRVDPRCRRILAPVRYDPIAEALGLIERQPAADWTVAALARAVGMGRSNFAAQFTRTIGKAPMEVLVDRRMRQAAALLHDERLKIAAIGELVGYGSEAAFSRRFARHFGMTASRMREQVRLAVRDQSPAPTPTRLLGGRATPPPAIGAVVGRAFSATLAGSSSRALLMMRARRAPSDEDP